MYLEDAPIKKQSEDLLNRRNFAKRLGKSILNSSTKDGFCIGLYGPWGSGKSSVVNMIIEEINKNVEENEPIIMYFNPWNFSSTNQLLQQYFVMLAEVFENKKNEKMSKIGKEIQKYADMLDAFGVLGKIAGTGGQVLGGLLYEKSIQGTDNLTKQRDMIIDLIAKQERKLIIIIDDIDRLSNEEIKLIFQLVNSVAKFPNTIYLLSFDKDIVSRALAAVQNYDGEKYLEKIIQVPINIPEVSNDFLWKALFDKLEMILVSQDTMIWEPDYWHEVFSKCVSKYISNIRDIIRLTNVLNTKVHMVGNEINYVDMIGITIIENHLPKLYKWIKFNKEILIGSEAYSFEIVGKKPLEIEQRIKNQMEDIEAGRGDELVNILSIFFPYFATKINRGYYNEKSLRRNQRIGHPDKFDLYFGLDIDSIEMTRADFDHAVYFMDELSLKEYIQKANRNDFIISFLKELASVNDDLSAERSSILIRVLFETMALLKGTENSFWSLSAFDMAEFRIRDLFQRIETEEIRYKLLLDITNKADLLTIPSLASFLNTTELAFGRLAAKGEDRSIAKIISLEQLEEYEQAFLKHLKQISEENNLLEMDNAKMVLYLYECFDECGYKSYMDNQLKNKLNVLIYLSFSSGKWMGSTGAGFEYYEDYKKLVDDERVEEAINLSIEDKSILNLNENILQRVAAYVLWREKKINWNGRVEEPDVNSKILQWREEIE